MSDNNQLFRRIYNAWATRLGMNKKQLRLHAAALFGKTPGWYESRERYQTNSTEDDVQFILECAEKDTSEPVQIVPDQFMCSDCEFQYEGQPKLVIPRSFDLKEDLRLCAACAGDVDPAWTPFPDYSIWVEKLRKEAEAIVSRPEIAPRG